eukprot:192386_1
MDIEMHPTANSIHERRSLMAESIRLSQRNMTNEEEEDEKHGQIKREKHHQLKTVLFKYQSLDEHELHDGAQTPLTTPLKRSHKTILGDEVSTEAIAETLRRNEVLISDEDLANILKAYKNKKSTLIDELCDGYQTTKDKDVPLCKALGRCKMLWPDRQRFYDIVLKQYVPRELNNKNFIKILKKTIIYLQLNVDLTECEALAKKANLKGKLFFETLEDKKNNEYKSPEEFAKAFEDMKNVRPQIWMRIYRHLNAWETED